MNQLRIPKLFVLLIIFIPWACDQAIDEVSPESRHSWERKTISVSDSENLGNILKDIMNSPSGARIETHFGELDQTEVAMIKFDSLERFSLLFKSDDPFIFSNLIIQNVNGKTTTKILRQVPDLEWIATSGEEVQWKNFTGRLEIYNLDGELFNSTRMENGLSQDYYNGRVEDEVCTQTVIWQIIRTTPDGTTFTTYEYGTDCFFTGDNNLWYSGGGTGTTGSGGSSGTGDTKGGDTTHDSNIDCSTMGNEECPEAPDNPIPMRTIELSDEEIKRILSKKPLQEYQNKCTGASAMWNNYPNNEVNAYIAADGSLFVTDVLSYNGGNAQGLYVFEGDAYYASNGQPNLNYQGMIKIGSGRSQFYLIPVVASVHTHRH
ncbi:MAG: hypothetical protein R8G66_17940 [Cytophagales bacterium]|nr:hypothetical protein [Cytophagales bacterium]